MAIVELDTVIQNLWALIVLLIVGFVVYNQMRAKNPKLPDLKKWWEKE